MYQAEVVDVCTVKRGRGVSRRMRRRQGNEGRGRRTLEACKELTSKILDVTERERLVRVLLQVVEDGAGQEGRDEAGVAVKVEVGIETDAFPVGVRRSQSCRRKERGRCRERRGGNLLCPVGVVLSQLVEHSDFRLGGFLVLVHSPAAMQISSVMVRRG